MSELTVSALGEAERSGALDTLVLAFAADPVERWLYPQPDSYLGSFRRFLDAFGGRAFDEQTAWKIGQCAAVAAANQHLARVPGDPESAHDSLLRAPGLRGDRPGSSRELPSDHRHAAAGPVRPRCLSV